MEHHDWSGPAVPPVVPPMPLILPAHMEDLEARVMLSGDGPLNIPLAPMDEGGGDPPEVNLAPTAVDDEAIGDEGRLLYIDALANDTDPEGDRLRVVGHTQANNGVVVRMWGGRFAYKPKADFTGADSFEYVISDGHGNTAGGLVNITIRPAAENTAPVALDDPGTVGLQDTWINTVDVLANDTDADGDTLHVVGHTQPTHGRVFYRGGGVFTYRPKAGFAGEDTFKYTVGDWRGGRDTAEVTVTVEAAPENNLPDAVDDDATVTAGVWTTIPSVLDNDTDADGDRLRITKFTQPDVGRVVRLWGGKFLYRAPADAETGEDVDDWFTYTISDGRGGTDTATVNIDLEPAPANQGPVAVDDAYTTEQGQPLLTGNVLENDSDPDGGHIRIVDHGEATQGTVHRWGHARFLYVPDADATGSDSFTYTISDGQGGSATATVTITITPPPANTPPEAVDDRFEMRSGQEVLFTGNVLENDTDADGDILRVTGTTDPQPVHGTVEYLGWGRFKYVLTEDIEPDDDPDTPEDTFGYTVSDGKGGEATAVVNIHIAAPPVNGIPTPQDDTFTAQQDKPFCTPSVLKNDTDPDGHLLVITDYTDPANGTVDHALFGHFRYVPDEGFSGLDTFIYTVDDGHGGTATATVTIDVQPTPPNHPPVAMPDTFHTRENRPLWTPSVLRNNTDEDRDWLRIVEVSESAEGVIVIHKGGGHFYYVPPEDFTGQDTFTYTVSDGEDTATTTVTIIVDPLGDPAGPGPNGR